MNVRNWLTDALIAVALGSALQACGPTIRNAVEMRHEMALQASQPISQEGLVIEAKVLSAETAANDPRLMTKLTKLHLVGTQYHKSEIGWQVIDAPVFQLKVTNNTGHIVRLKGSVIKLVDAAGNMYDPLSKDLIIARNTAGLATYSKEQKAVNSSFMGFDGQVFDGSHPAIQNAVMMLKILDANTELLPNMTETFFMAFQLPFEPGSVAAYDDWVARQSTLTMKLFEVTSETDAAGNPTKKVQFDFPVVIKSYKDYVTYTDGDRQLARSEEVAK